MAGIPRCQRQVGARQSALAAGEIAEAIGNAEGMACAAAELARVELASDDIEAAMVAAQRATDRFAQIDSGELWRALHASGLAYAARFDASGAPADADAAIHYLDRALRQRAAVRNQIPEQDRHRRTMAARGLAAPARDLQRLLRATGQNARARDIEMSWPRA